MIEIAKCTRIKKVLIFLPQALEEADRQALEESEVAKEVAPPPPIN